MEKNNEVFNETVNTLFQGMDGFISTKTVVGDAIHIGDTIIVPLRGHFVQKRKITPVVVWAENSHRALCW